MRIGLFTHSTNRRGGVVHALALGRSLRAAGHDVRIVAADAKPDPEMLVVPSTGGGTLAETVGRRMADLRCFFRAPAAPRFDVWHAQDPITANALAALRRDGVLPGFARTVHHLDAWDDPRLRHWQDEGVRQADIVLSVSRHWQSRIEAAYAVAAPVVGNGVDPRHFRPAADRSDAALAARLGLPRDGAGPVFVALGGIEARKNAARVVEAFLRFRAHRPSARLVIAGGASLLDHGGERARVRALLADADAAASVLLPGPLPDAEIPALYRLADAVLQVSLAEGFGLCPLEAMACGRPVVLSAIAPFDEHVAPHEAVWSDPLDVRAIERALGEVVRPETARRLRALGPATAARFSWTTVARAHLPFYSTLLQRVVAHA